MELHEDPTFDSSTELHGADPLGADHDSALGDSDHYNMMPNDGTDDSSGYGDNSSTNGGSESSYGDDSSSGSDQSPAATSSDSTGSDSTGSAGTVSIVVDGHTYTEAGHTNSAGYNEADIHLSDGDTVLAVDTDHDGQADVAGVEDSSGQLIDEQHLDPSSGQWINDGPPDSSDGGSSAGSVPQTTNGSSTDSTDTTSGSDTSGDSTDGSSSAGAAPAATGAVAVDVDGHAYTAAEQYDVNQDGRADSGTVEVDGKTYLLTDFDGDGNADHVEVGVDGEWKSGYSIDGGQFSPDPGTTPDPSDLPGGGTSGFTETGADYSVDPQTGEWTTTN